MLEYPKSWTLILSILACVSGVSVLSAKEQHGAHVHGEAKLNVAIEGSSGTIEFESPSESIYGFERLPKNAAETKARDAAMATLKTDIGKMIVFEDAKRCRILAKSVDSFASERNHQDAKKSDKAPAKSTHREEHGEHGEVRAEFALTCDADLGGSTVEFAFWKFFPRLKSVDVQFIGKDSKGKEFQQGGEFSVSKSSLRL